MQEDYLPLESSISCDFITRYLFTGELNPKHPLKTIDPAAIESLKNSIYHDATMRPNNQFSREEIEDLGNKLGQKIWLPFVWHKIVTREYYMMVDDVKVTCTEQEYLDSMKTAEQAQLKAMGLSTAKNYHKAPQASDKGQGCSILILILIIIAIVVGLSSCTKPEPVAPAGKYAIVITGQKNTAITVTFSDSTLTIKTETDTLNSFAIWAYSGTYKSGKISVAAQSADNGKVSVEIDLLKATGQKDKTLRDVSGTGKQSLSYP